MLSTAVHPAAYMLWLLSVMIEFMRENAYPVSKRKCCWQHHNAEVRWHFSSYLHVTCCHSVKMILMLATNLCVCMISGNPAFPFNLALHSLNIQIFVIQCPTRFPKEDVTHNQVFIGKKVFYRRTFCIDLLLQTKKCIPHMCSYDFLHSLI